MYRLALLFLCFGSANCTVLTDVLSSDLTDADLEESDAGPLEDAAADAMAAMLECLPGYTEQAGTCHRVVMTATAWVAAEAACELDGLGAHLVIIDDEAEQEAVPDGSWIGLYESDAAGTFLTVTNQPPPFENWAGGNPANGGGLCVDKRSEGWHDDNCLLLKPFVCEYDMVPADTPYLP